MLMVATSGRWSSENRTDFLNWLIKVKNYPGGKQMAERLQNLRDDFVNQMSEAEQQQYQTLLAEFDAPPAEEVSAPARPQVRQWTLEELEGSLAEVETGRSYQQARQALLAASCLKCHRINNSGAYIGPDLTNVGKRFDSRTILESIIEPSKVIDPKYQHTLYILTNGKIVTGRPAGFDGTSLKLETDPINETIITIKRDEIDESILSKTSPMPPNLINVLTREEILDLLAYLRTGGDATAPAFNPDPTNK
ncbi:MAG: c-type cytochrome [Planctomycetaceae bacterium]